MFLILNFKSHVHVNISLKVSDFQLKLKILQGFEAL